MTSINSLWNSRNEAEWRDALQNYWGQVKPTHLDVEKEFDSLDTQSIKEMGPEQWYEFLLQKYFYWKYTAPNRYATTTAQLKKYKTIDNGLAELFSIKEKIFDFDKEDICLGLEISGSIRGLGPAGASGLLAVLFPAYFATVDQFVVESLSKINSLPEKDAINSMPSQGMRIKDAVILIEIMRRKAKALNQVFTTSFWTPRKIDQILWSVGR